MESKEALDMAKVKEAAAEFQSKEASSKLAGLLAREQAVADYKEQQIAARQATEAADQVGSLLAISLPSNTTAWQSQWPVGDCSQQHAVQLQPTKAIEYAPVIDHAFSSK